MTETALTYTPQVVDHAQHPRNVGQVPDADGIGQMGDRNCGDFAVMTIKVREGRIISCKFLVRGCGAAIATCSITTEMAQGKTLAEAMAMTDQNVLDALGGLPPAKEHCSNLAAGALHEAISDYWKRNRANLRDWRSMYQRR